MDAIRLRTALRERAGDALADLETEAALFAICDGVPNRRRLLRATWASERAAAETFAHWAGTTSPGRTRTTFVETAEQEREHAKRVATLLESSNEGLPVDASTVPGPLHAYLRGLDDRFARIGAGLIGRPLASLRTYALVRRWATDAEDESLDACFAALASETDASVTTGAELIDTVADGPAAYEKALSAASYVVMVIRDEYADALVGLGRSFE